MPLVKRCNWCRVKHRDRVENGVGRYGWRRRGAGGRSWTDNQTYSLVIFLGKFHSHSQKNAFFGRGILINLHFQGVKSGIQKAFWNPCITHLLGGGCMRSLPYHVMAQMGCEAIENVEWNSQTSQNTKSSAWRHAKKKVRPARMANYPNPRRQTP